MHTTAVVNRSSAHVWLDGQQQHFFQNVMTSSAYSHGPGSFRVYSHCNSDSTWSSVHLNLHVHTFVNVYSVLFSTCMYVGVSLEKLTTAPDMKTTSFSAFLLFTCFKVLSCKNRFFKTTQEGLEEMETLLNTGTCLMSAKGRISIIKTCCNEQINNYSIKL